MEISNITTSLVAIYSLILTVIFLKSLKKYHKINLQNSLNKERLSGLLQENEQQREQLKELDKENRGLMSCKGAFEQLQKNNENLRLDLKISSQNIENLQNKLAQAEKKQELIEQQKDQLKNENENWESQKTAIINKISAEIIKVNDESQNKISEKQGAEIKQITADLLKKFETVDHKVKSMNDDLEKSMLDVDLTKNALLSPGGAGRMAELTLENILKASGLKQKKNIADDGDFILQPYIIGEIASHGKRPDAMVFLPKDQILIIDSKSSSHFLQLQQNCQNGDKNAKKEILGKIKDRIKSHIDDLKKRDYSEHKIREIGLNNWLKKDLSQIKIMTVMFLQTESMLALIREIDPNIEYVALEAGIPMLSPIGLINLLTQSKILIYNSKQEHNIYQLRNEIQKLVGSITIIFTKSENLGKSLNRSLQYYNEFVGSFNRSFLTRIKNINSLGAISVNQTDIKKLKKIQQDDGLIEVEEE